LNVDESQLGQAVQCPACGTQFTASLAVTNAPRPAPPPPEREPPRRRYVDAPPPRYGRDYDDRGREYDDRDRGYGGGYGRGYDYRDPYRRVRPHRGSAVMTLGIIGLVLFCIPLAGWTLGGVALAMGNNDLSEMNRGLMDESGRGATNAGRVCGIIAVVLSSLIFVLACLIQVGHGIK
jgi:hypothetical protein